MWKVLQCYYEYANPSFLLWHIIGCADTSAQWVHVNNLNNIICFASLDTSLFAGSNGGKVYRSNDKGITWTDQSKGLPDKQINALLVSGSNIFATTLGDTGIYRSSDNGDTWSPSSKGMTFGNVYNLVLYGNKIFAMASRAERRILFSSTNEGDDWNFVDSSLTYVNTFGVSGNNFFVGGQGMNLSIDSGHSWKPINNGFWDPDVICMDIIGTKEFVSSGQAGMYFSMDTGNSWVQRRPENICVLYSFASYGNNLFAGMQFYGIELTTDDGLHWTQVIDGIDSQAGQLSVGDLFIFKDYIFCSPGYGSLWRRPLSEMILSAVLSPNQQSAFHLAQNYPNPFSESTTLRFDLPERTFVSLKVYDITGREVAVLVNETLDAGSYSRAFNADGIPSGTYICHLEAGGFRQEKTLFLMR